MVELTPILYAAGDIKTCLFECRASPEHDLFVAALKPATELKLFNLTGPANAQLSEDETLPPLTLSRRESSAQSRLIAAEAYRRGFDGVAYPSYFSRWQFGNPAFGTMLEDGGTYHLQFTPTKDEPLAMNYAIFGRPVLEERLRVVGINRLLLTKVSYDFQAGPAWY